MIDCDICRGHCLCNSFDCYVEQNLSQILFHVTNLQCIANPFVHPFVSPAPGKNSILEIAWGAMSPITLIQVTCLKKLREREE